MGGHLFARPSGPVVCNGCRLARSEAIGAEIYRAASELADTDPDESVARTAPTTVPEP